MTADATKTRALVLGGGGVTGIAWELGIVCALSRAGLELASADLVTGTSAGSVVGSQISGGADLEKLLEAQMEPVVPGEELAAEFDLSKLQVTLMGIIKEVGLNPQAIRAGIGKLALEVPVPSGVGHRDVIQSRLPVQDWPEKRLLLTAVEAESGEWKVFDRESGVGLIDAVAASCAVPLVWPPVTIDGKHYMDGGVRSITNADLAKGCDRVLVIMPIALPLSTAALFGSDLKQEKELLEQAGSRVLVISPDEKALAAIGPNVLDPARRAAAANAGLEQGRSLVEPVRQLWNGE